MELGTVSAGSPIGAGAKQRRVALEGAGAFEKASCPTYGRAEYGSSSGGSEKVSIGWYQDSLMLEPSNGLSEAERRPSAVH